MLPTTLPSIFRHGIHWLTMEPRVLEGGLCLQTLLGLFVCHPSMAEHPILFLTYQRLMHNMKVVLLRVGLAAH